jgi:hypothetical protein
MQIFLLSSLVTWENDISRENSLWFRGDSISIWRVTRWFTGAKRCVEFALLTEEEMYLEEIMYMAAW